MTNAARPPAGPEEFIRSVADFLTEAVYATTPAGIIHYWNAGAEAMFGFSRAEAVGKSYLDLIVPADKLEVNRERLRKIPATRTRTTKASG